MDYAGYYDEGPRVKLDRHLAIIGFLASGVEYVAREVSSVTGLPLYHLDRLVEHSRGMSTARLHIEFGEPARRVAESEALQSVANQKPYGVVALGDGVMLKGLNASLIADTFDLVYVHRPMDVSLALVQRSFDQSRERIPEYTMARPCNADSLNTYFDARKAGYARAKHRIEAGDLHPAKIAEKVLEVTGLRAQMG